MTLRLSAMFEEHMEKIIYNWKSARRREGIIRSKNKRVRNKRRTGQRTTRHHSSDEDSEEITSSSSPVRKSVTPRKVNIVTNGHASTSRSNGPVPRTGIRVRHPVQKEKVVKRSFDLSDDDFSDAEKDSEDSYKPNRRGKKIVTRNKGKQKKHYRVYSEEEGDSDISKRTRAKTAAFNQLDDDSDSDNEPLVNCVNNWHGHHSESEDHISHRLRSSHDETSQGSSSRPAQRTRKIFQETDEDEEESEEVQLPQRQARVKRFNYRTMLEFSEDSDEENINPRTRKGKRPHYNEDTEDENNSRRRPKRRHVNEDSDSNNDTTNIISISSRGRIRKLTPRAKAFLRD